MTTPNEVPREAGDDFPLNPFPYQTWVDRNGTKRIFTNGLWYIHDEQSELTTLRERVRDLEISIDLIKRVDIEKGEMIKAQQARIRELEAEIQLSEVAGMVKDARIRELEEAMSEVREKLLEPGWPEDKDLPGIADIIEKVMTKKPSEK